MVEEHSLLGRFHGGINYMCILGLCIVRTDVSENISPPSSRSLRASTASYWDRFTLSYVDDVRTSQGTHLRASTACYGDRFIFICR
jgi:hypothetical protein